MATRSAGIAGYLVVVVAMGTGRAQDDPAGLRHLVAPGVLPIPRPEPLQAGLFPFHHGHAEQLQSSALEPVPLPVEPSIDLVVAHGHGRRPAAPWSSAHWSKILVNARLAGRSSDIIVSS